MFSSPRPPDASTLAPYLSGTADSLGRVLQGQVVDQHQLRPQPPEPRPAGPGRPLRPRGPSAGPPAVPARRRAASSAVRTPPRAATWLSFTKTASERLILWLEPPPQRTAYFSTARRPGNVLRVSLMTAPVPATASTAAAVIVATPERWVTRLRTVRSAASSVSAGPASTPRTSEAPTRAPSSTRGWPGRGRYRAAGPPRRGPAERPPDRRPCPAWRATSDAFGRPGPDGGPGGVAGGEVLGHGPRHHLRQLVPGRRGRRAQTRAPRPPARPAPPAPPPPPGGPPPCSPPATSWSDLAQAPLGAGLGVVGPPMRSPGLVAGRRQAGYGPGDQDHVGQLPSGRALDRRARVPSPAR